MSIFESFSAAQKAAATSASDCSTAAQPLARRPRHLPLSTRLATWLAVSLLLASTATAVSMTWTGAENCGSFSDSLSYDIDIPVGITSMSLSSCTMTNTFLKFIVADRRSGGSPGPLLQVTFSGMTMTGGSLMFVGPSGTGAVTDLHVTAHECTMRGLQKAVAVETSPTESAKTVTLIATGSSVLEAVAYALSVRTGTAEYVEIDASGNTDVIGYDSSSPATPVLAASIEANVANHISIRASGNANVTTTHGGLISFYSSSPCSAAASLSAYSITLAGTNITIGAFDNADVSAILGVNVARAGRSAACGISVGTGIGTPNVGLTDLTLTAEGSSVKLFANGGYTSAALGVAVVCDGGPAHLSVPGVNITARGTVNATAIGVGNTYTDSVGVAYGVGITGLLLNSAHLNGTLDASNATIAASGAISGQATGKGASATLGVAFVLTQGSGDAFVNVTGTAISLDASSASELRADCGQECATAVAGIAVHHGGETVSLDLNAAEASAIVSGAATCNSTCTDNCASAAIGATSQLRCTSYTLKTPGNNTISFRGFRVAASGTTIADSTGRTAVGSAAIGVSSMAYLNGHWGNHNVDLGKVRVQATGDTIALAEATGSTGSVASVGVASLLYSNSATNTYNLTTVIQGDSCAVIATGKVTSSAIGNGVTAAAALGTAIASRTAHPFSAAADARHVLTTMTFPYALVSLDCSSGCNATAQSKTSDSCVACMGLGFNSFQDSGVAHLSVDVERANITANGIVGSVVEATSFSSARMVAALLGISARGDAKHGANVDTKASAAVVDTRGVTSAHVTAKVATQVAAAVVGIVSHAMNSFSSTGAATTFDARNAFIATGSAITVVTEVSGFSSSPQAFVAGGMLASPATSVQTASSTLDVCNLNVQGFDSKFNPRGYFPGDALTDIQLCTGATPAPTTPAVTTTLAAPTSPPTTSSAGATTSVGTSAGTPASAAPSGVATLPVGTPAPGSAPSSTSPSASPSLFSLVVTPQPQATAPPPTSTPVPEGTFEITFNFTISDGSAPHSTAAAFVIGTLLCLVFGA